MNCIRPQLATGEKHRRLALVALVFGATAIACAPIFVRLSVLGPSATAFYRLFIALPVLWLWLQLENHYGKSQRAPSTTRDYWRLLTAGLFFAGDLALWHWSILYTSVANATLFANFAPVFVTLGAWLIFGQRFRLIFILGMALALLGAVAVIGDSISLSARHIKGDVLGIMTAVFYAGYLLSVSHLRTDFSTATIMAWSGAVSAVVLLPIALLSGESLVATSVYGWMVLIGLALVSHAGGQSLIAYALAHLSVAFSSVSLLLQPVIAALLAWLVLSEPLHFWQAIGGLAVLTGIGIASKARLSSVTS
jgi:drug/metabolite transporter (DMT)-like permease